MTAKEEAKKEAKQLGKSAVQQLVPMFIAWVRERIDARRARRKAGK